MVFTRTNKTLTEVLTLMEPGETIEIRQKDYSSSTIRPVASRLEGEYKVSAKRGTTVTTITRVR